TICCELLRELRRDGGGIKEDVIEVRCHADIADMLATQEQAWIDEIEKRLQKKIVIKARECHLEEYQLVGKEGGRERREGRRKEPPPPAADAAPEPEAGGDGDEPAEHAP